MDIIKKLLSTTSLVQKKFSFDKKTLKKILKGALITGTGTAALYLLAEIGKVEYSNANIVALITFGVPFLTNIIKEWMSGDSSK